MNPKEVSGRLGKSPSEIRRVLRKLFGKTEKGRWDITDDQFRKLEEYFKSGSNLTIEMESKSQQDIQIPQV